MANSTHHLVDLASVNDDELNQVIVSRQGNTIISRYGDDVWNLAPYVAQKNMTGVRIVFSSKLNKDGRLTDPAYAPLIASAKRFLYTRWRVAS